MLSAKYDLVAAVHSPTIGVRMSVAQVCIYESGFISIVVDQDAM